MFKNDRYAVHSIVETNQLGFSPVDYSKFKYGDISIAQKFGNELFDYFLRDILNSNHALPKSFIVYSSPYFFLPTSSLHMTKAFYDRFVGFAKEHHELINDIKIGKIDRCHSYTSDYGAMTAEERFELIKNDTYKFNELPDSKSTLLFLDDISITGTHQLVIENLLEENGIKNNCLFLYYAKLDNKGIPPNFENELNYAHIKNVHDLIPLILSENFQNTTRTTKYILSLPAAHLNLLFDALLDQDKKELLEELLDGALQNDYHLEESYALNIDCLKNRVLSNALIN
jgi:hypothetical protein